MHPILEGAFRKKSSFLFFLSATGPILLIDCPLSRLGSPWWLCFHYTAASILTQLPFPTRAFKSGNSPYPRLPFPKADHSGSAVSLAWACSGPARS